VAKSYMADLVGLVLSTHTFFCLPSGSIVQPTLKQWLQVSL